MPKKKDHRYPYFEHALIGTVILLLVLLVLTYTGIISRPAFQQTKIPTTTVDRTTVTDPYLHAEEAVPLITKDADNGNEEIREIEKVLFEYIEVTDGCGPHFDGECLNVRSEPSTDAPVVAQLRNGIVLKVSGQVENDGVVWYKVIFDEWLRYPERVAANWYVAADYVEVLLDEGEKTTWENGVATTTKHILVDRSDQKLYAYDGDELFMEASISTGLELSPTPRGEFTIFRKTPSRYMQGPLPYITNSDYYDLPGVPWNLYFTEQGAVIHGAYWHNSFGSRYSHGCVNMDPNEAQTLYNWAVIGTKVLVRD